MSRARREGWNWVWLALLLADVYWEASAAISGGTPLNHGTLSKIVKRWEGIDPETGRPVVTPVGLVKRGVVALALLGGCVYLLLHWVFQVIE
jgi:hypothetical protein